MKKIIFLLLYPLTLFGQIKVVDKLPILQSSQTYLFEKGKVYNIGAISKTIDSVTFDSYGIGAKPVINGSIDLQGTCNKINNLNFVGDRGYDKPTLVRLRKGNNVRLSNCVINGGAKGVQIESVVNAYIDNVELYNHTYDAIYMQYNDSVYINNVKIHSAYSDSTYDNALLSIDNLHIEATNYIMIDSLYSDHSNYGGKYALIINKYDTVSITNSVLKAPEHSNFNNYQNSAGIYAGGGSDKRYTWNIENCYISGIKGVWNYSKKLEIKNTVFKDCTTGIWEGGLKYIVNCNFINCTMAFRSWGISKMKAVENSIFYNCGTIYGTNDTAFASNNCYFPVPKIKPVLGINYITADPLFTDSINMLPESECLKLGIGVIRAVLVIINPCQSYIDLLNECLEQFNKSYLSAKQKGIMREKINYLINN